MRRAQLLTEARAQLAAERVRLEAARDEMRHRIAAEHAAWGLVQRLAEAQDEATGPTGEKRYGQTTTADLYQAGEPGETQKADGHPEGEEDPGVDSQTSEEKQERGDEETGHVRP